MEVKDYISLSLARKLYRSGDKELVNLALKTYSTDELDAPDYTSLITEYNKSEERNKMIRLQNINFTLAAIAYKFYGNDKNYENDFCHFNDCWIVINNGTGYTAAKPVFGRFTDVYFASKEDASRAAYYLNIYEIDGLFDKQ